MDPKKLLPKNYSRSIIVLAVLLAAILLIFKVGVIIGQRQADFSYRWSENYHRNFGGPQGGWNEELDGKNFIAGHGNVGEVVKVENNSLVIIDPAGKEKIISLTEKTIIHRERRTIKPEEIKIADRVVVLGEPKDDGTILAKLIRIFCPKELPPPPRHYKPFELFDKN